MGTSRDRSAFRSAQLMLVGVPAVVITIVIAAWSGVPALGQGRPWSAVLALAVGGAVLVVVTELLVRPAVRVRADGVALVNPWRTVTVPWAELEETEVVLGLRLVTADRRYRSWAASGGPGLGSSAWTGQGIEADHPLHLPTGMGRNAGPTLQALIRGESSGRPSPAKVMVDRAWQEWQGRGRAENQDGGDRAEGRDGGGVVATWHATSMAVVAGCLLVCVVARVVAGASA